MKKNVKWSVYIIECANGSLYTGATNDVQRRFNEHAAGKGARFTRAFGVKRLVYLERRGNRSQALKREAAIKAFTRKEKLCLIGSKKSSVRVDLRRRTSHAVVA